MKMRFIFSLILFANTYAFGQLQDYSEEKFRKDLINNLENLDQIEGIWNVVTTQETYHFDTLFEVLQSKQPERIAVVKNKSKFYSYTMSGELFETEFGGTDVKSVYLYRNFYPLISKYTKNHAVICKNGQMEYTYDYPEEYLREKLGSGFKEGLRIVNILKWSRVFPAK